MPTFPIDDFVAPRRAVLLAGAASLLGTASTWARTVGSGRVLTEPRAVADFDAIAIGGAIDLVVRQGTKEALELSADDNVLPLIEAVVESGGRGRTLSIRLRRGESVSSKTTIRATVDVVKLHSLAAAGSGQLRVGSLKTPTLRLSVSGSGDAQLEALTTDALEVRVAGSGNVRGAGTAGQVKLSISGSGEVDLLPLAADDVTVSIAGSGNAKVTANKALSVSIAGSGDVVYSGAASAIHSSVAGSGKLTRR